MNSTPVAVPSRELPAQSTGGVLGSSPRPASTPASAARKFFKRLQYDASLDQCQFSAGLLETREQAERKSGAEAWSMRLHSSLLELPFTDFLARYGEDVPFHRIVWFKQNGVIVWEAENLKMKLAGDGSGHHHHHHHSSSGIPQQLPPVPVLGSSFTGCSPPAGSFMARLAAGAAAAAPGTTPSSSAALPPRAGSLPLNADHSSGSSQHWKPQRHSGTDFTGSPSSWGGPGHWSAAAAARGGLCGTGGGSGAGSYHGHSPAGQSPLLGTSPIGCCALSAGPTPSSAPFGTSPKCMSGMLNPSSSSWTGNAGSFTGPCGGILSTSLRGAGGCSSYVTSPAGSCSSSWTGTSPLAAAAAAGVPLPLPSVTSSGSLGTAGVIAGTVGFAGDAVALELLQQQGSDAAAAAGGEGGE